MTVGADAFPSWDSTGIIPPNNPDAPTGTARSPYVVSLLELTARLGSTEPRYFLLRGLLDFRAELHSAGLTQGFQWIDGSFVENVKETADRPPNDIDVVTFFHIPNGHTQESLFQGFPDLFITGQAKALYGIDAYYVPLDQASMEIIIERTAYWHSLWSHTRDGLWKGYLQVDLYHADDEVARADLEQAAAERGQS